MLPRVREELLASTLASINSRIKNSEQCIYQKIHDENPVLWKLISLVIKSDKSEDFKDGYVKAAAQFYKLLNNQAEVDELEAFYEQEEERGVRES
jgi:hypothetical protein